MPNSDPWDRFVHPYLTRMSDSYILTSVKGCKSVTNFCKMAHYNPNLDFVNVNVYTKFGQILSIHSQNIERKHHNYRTTITEQQKNRANPE